MSALNVLALVAPNVSNEVLGLVAAELVKGGMIGGEDFGRILRPALPTPSVAEAATGVSSSAATKGSQLPESAAARTALLETVYGSFESHRRRSVEALSRATGLNTDAVLMLLDGNRDFRVSSGQESGRTFVSLRGAR